MVRKYFHYPYNLFSIYRLHARANAKLEEGIITEEFIFDKAPFRKAMPQL